MTFEERVNNLREYFNETDDIILFCIKENIDKIATVTIQKMSKELYIAPNSIMRFAKKLGYSGFAELKFSIQNERQPKGVTIGRQLLGILPANVVKTLDIIDTEQIEIVAKMIYESKSCILAGVGDSGYFCELLGKNLRCVDCNVQYYSQIHDMIYAVEHATKNDLVIVISARGENERLNWLARTALQKNIKLVSITHVKNNPLSEMATHSLYFWGEHRTVQGYNVTDKSGLMLLIRLICEVYWKKYSFL